MTSIPYQVLQAMIQCFGRAFHYKDNVESFFTTCGVNKALASRDRASPKFVWGRNVLTELGQSEDGRMIQRRILTELCKLRDLPDKEVKDRNAGLDALRDLKRLALEQNLIAEEEIEKGGDRKKHGAERAKVAQERAKTMEALKGRFSEGVVDSNRQRAGYSLEDLLKDLFALFEIEYTKPFRTSTQQIDGHFKFDSFDYLVEAKWRSDQPTDGEIGSFKAKVDSKFQSTRGLFVSVQGFRPEVAAAYNGRGSNIILMNGEDFVEILEGRIDLRDALKFKIEHAAQKGEVYVSLKRRF